MDSYNEIRDNIVLQERIYKNCETLNKETSSNNSLIVHVNIRSLNANFSKLLILIES